MDVILWVNDVTGKPWIDRTEGPESYDCWGLVVDSFRRIDGVEIEPVDGYSSGDPIEKAGKTEQNSGRWTQLEKPTHGAIFCAYSPVGDLAHVGRVLLLKGAGLFCAHARGSNGKGQVAIDTVRVLERYYQNGNVKYFIRNESYVKPESTGLFSTVANWFKG